MTDASRFDSSIRREERSGVHTELLNRLQQHGVSNPSLDATDGELADLLSAVEGFERAVERAGGDLFVDSPDSSEPERPDFVIPHPHDDERVPNYTRRIREAAARLESRGSTS